MFTVDIFTRELGFTEDMHSLVSEQESNLRPLCIDPITLPLSYQTQVSDRSEIGMILVKDLYRRILDIG